MRRWLTLAAYLVIALVWVYAVVNEGDTWSRIPASVEYPLAALLYLALGLALGTWWALLLPAATVLLALPAGSNSQMGEFDVVAFDPLYALPYGLLGVAAGVILARRLRFRRR